MSKGIVLLTAFLFSIALYGGILYIAYFLGMLPWLITVFVLYCVYQAAVTASKPGDDSASRY
jgi:hypothetical protein